MLWGRWLSSKLHGGGYQVESYIFLTILDFVNYF